MVLFECNSRCCALVQNSKYLAIVGTPILDKTTPGKNTSLVIVLPQKHTEAPEFIAAQI